MLIQGASLLPFSAYICVLLLGFRFSSVWEVWGYLFTVLTRTAANCCSSGLPELLGWQNCAAAMGSTISAIPGY